MDVLTLDISSFFKKDFCEIGLELVEDIEPQLGKANLEIMSFMLPEEDWIHGEDLICTAVRLGANLGQRGLEAMLDRQQDIPKSWQIYTFVGTTTIWRNQRGVLFVPDLVFLPGTWHLSFRFLAAGFDSYARLGRLSS